jgi:hypothetical protein
MKLHTILLAAGLALGPPQAAWSQTAGPGSPVARADATGLVGWLSSNKPLDHYDDWDHSLYGGATFGWYWTDHLKTEIEAGVSSRSEKHTYSNEPLGAVRIAKESTFHFSTRRLAIGQQYQFYRNVMFHPYLAGGLELTWDKTERSDGAESIYDPAVGRVQPGLPAIVHPPRTELIARGYAATGFKAYMSPKAFFRSDLKLAIRSGVQEVLFRVGFGADF